MKILVHCWSRNLTNGKVNPKNYPHWDELIARLQADGHQLTQIGSSREKKCCDNFKENLNFAQLREVLREHDLFISVDSFLQHMAHYYGKRGIVLFGISAPELFGYKENINLFQDRSYFRPNQFDIWENAEVNDEAFVLPSKIIEVVNNWNK